MNVERVSICVWICEVFNDFQRLVMKILIFVEKDDKYSLKLVN